MVWVCRWAAACGDYVRWRRSRAAGAWLAGRRARAQWWRSRKAPVKLSTRVGGGGGCVQRTANTGGRRSLGLPKAPPRFEIARNAHGFEQQQQQQQQFGARGAETKAGVAARSDVGWVKVAALRSALLFLAAAGPACCHGLRTAQIRSCLGRETAVERRGWANSLPGASLPASAAQQLCPPPGMMSSIRPVGHSSLSSLRPN